ncbi:MAG: Sec-independent protein translocase subunit TatA [Microbacterium sp.]
MQNLFAGPHLWIILIVIVLLFGAAKLPALAKSVGQSARIFKGEMKAMKDDDASVATAESTGAQATASSTGAQATAVAPSAAVDPVPPVSPDSKS